MGGVYSGEWLGGFRDGRGLMVWKDGSKYEGNFSFGRPWLSGKFTYYDGDVYEGEWRRYYSDPEEIFGSRTEFHK